MGTSAQCCRIPQRCFLSCSCLALHPEPHANWTVHLHLFAGWSFDRRVLVVHSDGSEEVVEIKKDLGVRADDVAEMRRRLIAQGVKDIARIELTG